MLLNVVPFGLLLLTIHHVQPTVANPNTDYNLPLIQETITIIGRDIFKGVTRMLNGNSDFSFGSDEQPPTEIASENVNSVNESSLDFENWQNDETPNGSESNYTNDSQISTTEDIPETENTFDSGMNEDEFDTETPLVDTILKHDEENVDYAKTLAQTAVNVAARKLMKQLGNTFRNIYE